MTVSHKIGVLITKKYFIMFPYIYLIFHVGKFWILGQANICLFSTKKVWPFHTNHMAKSRIYEFSAKNNLCPCEFVQVHLQIWRRKKWHNFFLAMEMSLLFYKFELEGEGNCWCPRPCDARTGWNWFSLFLYWTRLPLVQRGATPG